MRSYRRRVSRLTGVCTCSTARSVGLRARTRRARPLKVRAHCSNPCSGRQPHPTDRVCATTGSRYYPEKPLTEEEAAELAEALDAADRAAGHYDAHDHEPWHDEEEEEEEEYLHYDDEEEEEEGFVHAEGAEPEPEPEEGDEIGERVWTEPLPTYRC